jgi:hypothetical protein
MLPAGAGVWRESPLILSTVIYAPRGCVGVSFVQDKSCKVDNAKPLCAIWKTFHFLSFTPVLLSFCFHFLHVHGRARDR